MPTGATNNHHVDKIAADRVVTSRSLKRGQQGKKGCASIVLKTYTIHILNSIYSYTLIARIQNDLHVLISQIHL